jgi:hypothetical protein
MSEEIIASHIKAEAKYGQNGSDTPSSIQKGADIKRSKIGKSIIAADPVTAGAGTWQVRPVSSKQAVKTNPGTTKNPNASPAKIPATTNRGSIAQIMARQGHAKR